MSYRFFMVVGNPNFGPDYKNKFNYGRERPFDSSILLRLYSEDKQKLEAIAAAQGQSVSDLLRSLIKAL
ncbi:hypothetical protein [Kamptonema animale]|uniref:hypothetical protein n=1 Tax=Kamptonema animale TaxID=92934 RepID=UPI00232CD6A6|nr:hypothetical protein [Kamptonema animale]